MPLKVHPHIPIDHVIDLNIHSYEDAWLAVKLVQGILRSLNAETRD